MHHFMYIILALLMGIVMSIYIPMNSSVSRYIGSPVTANVTFFFIALVTAVLIFLVFGQLDSMSNIKKVPLHLYTTGIISAFIILGMTAAIPQIGARTFFILLITGQIVMAIIISHFGVLESPTDPITARKIIGALVVIAGAAISVS